MFETIKLGLWILGGWFLSLFVLYLYARLIFTAWFNVKQEFEKEKK